MGLGYPQQWRMKWKGTRKMKGLYKDLEASPKLGVPCRGYVGAYRDQGLRFPKIGGIFEGAHN